MASRAELDNMFPSLVERYTDRHGYTDWHSLVEYLWIEEITTLRNRQWKWRNAESWWLRNRRRIMENCGGAASGKESNDEQYGIVESEESEAMLKPLTEGCSEIQQTEPPVQLALDFS